MTERERRDDDALELLLRQAGGRDARPGRGARRRARTALRREAAEMAGAREAAAETFPEILCAGAALPVLAVCAVLLLGGGRMAEGAADDLLRLLPVMNALCLPVAAGVVVRSRRRHAS